jgi:uncharacterized protein YdhG (YjbR/CyaY superfamily)
MNKVKTVDEYINSFPSDIQEKLKLLRQTIMKSVPQAQERISYAMPSYHYHGRLVYFAAWKNHIAIYAIFAPVRMKFESELKDYEKSKGTIQFPLDKKIPYGLIEKLVQAQASENERVSQK